MTALEAAAAALGVPSLSVVDTLGGSARSEVWRVSAPDLPRGTAIVKHHLQPERRTWVRESAGLAAAAGTRTPRLLAVVDDPAVVVMSDLGDGPNLADLLLGTDPRAAADGVRDWAEAVALVQEETVGRVGDFAAALGDLAAHSTMAEIDALPATLEETAARHALPWSDRVTAALGEHAAPLDDPAAQRFSPGDTCPDNNVRTPAGLHLIDLEFAEVRHRAWEAAYLRVPWPTCWCAWAIPDEVALTAAAPFEASADDVDRATLLWCLLSVSWFLAGALDPTSVNSDTERRPGRWTLVLSRLDLAARLPGPAALTSWAAALRDELAARWGEHPLVLAPAFR
ncbi:hypothetical protein [Nocardioides taihuensis]|uniref:Aminoglycoside phosphotransferase family protein n=1 Tax=Nocardioides taihuensis TaxID=1835606 RepID=A0ABW0BPB8_9ACTN